MSANIKLPPFKIIACVDSKFGIGKNGKIPWYNPEDLRWFAKKTANSVIIMGRKTHESIGKVLDNRINVVISSNDSNGSNSSNSSNGSNDSNTGNDKQSDDVYIASNLNDALAISAGFYKNIYVIGGGTVYQEAIIHPLCRKLIITHLPDSYDCDVVFPQIPPNIYNNVVLYRHPKFNLQIKLYYRSNNSESEYLGLLRRVLAAPQIDNRTDTPTQSVFGELIKYPLQDEVGNNIIPLFTTKFVPFRLVYEELLWFLCGSTNTDYLKLKNVGIWDANSTTKFLESAGLPQYREGELGPVYGHQWRRFNAPYVPECNIADPPNSAGFVDQISELIKGLKTNPLSRRHVVSAWNPQQLKEMALPPCHLLFIFNVQKSPDTASNKYLLNCHLTMRSNDLFLGHPFNAASYATLTHMIAKICDMTPGELAISIADAHIYINHINAIKEQLSRKPYGYPQITFSEKIEKMFNDDLLTIDDFKSDDVGVVNYYHQGRIAANMIA